jgi:hypothetical protein
VMLLQQLEQQVQPWLIAHDPLYPLALAHNTASLMRIVHTV